MTNDPIHPGLGGKAFKIVLSADWYQPKGIFRQNLLILKLYWLRPFLKKLWNKLPLPGKWKFQEINYTYKVKQL